MARNWQTKVSLVLVALLVMLGISAFGYGYSAQAFGNQIIQPVNAQTSVNSALERVDAAPGTILKSSTADFRLTIPKIGVDKEVVEDVNPGNEAIYGPVIAEKVAHGLYTRKPDEAVYDGNVYLFAHRSGVVNGKDVGFFKDLNKLNPGDRAQLRYAGKTYTYEFVRSFVITPQDTWVYTAKSAYPKLTLQTCEQGESLRLMVEFKLIKVA